MKNNFFYFCIVFVFTIMNACGDDSDADVSFLIDPEEIIFDGFEVGVTKTVPVTISNIGKVDLELSDINLSEKTLSDSGAEFKEGENWQGKAMLPPGEKLRIDVSYEPKDLEIDEGELTFNSNAQTNKHSIRIFSKISGGSTPEKEACLNILPMNNELSFGSQFLGETKVLDLRLENCSSRSDLKISDLKLCNVSGQDCEKDGPFSFKGTGLGEFEDTAGGTIKPLESLVLQVSYKSILAESKGRILFASDDLNHLAVKIDLVGKGTERNCPTSIVQGRKTGDPDFTADELNIELGNLVELSAERSVPLNSEIERYQWTFVARPQGSVGNLTSDGEETTEFRPDLVGEYVVELIVFDKEGVESCSPGRFNITVAYAVDGLVAILKWNTPQDPDQSDSNGSDLDLHYLHPTGEWNVSPLDIFFNNRTADWGVQADVDDNPTLLIDDSNGQGPEVISHSPSEALTYSVGVFYFSDGGLGESIATVQILIDGQMVFEKTNTLTKTLDFWHVANIRWDNKTVVEFDEISENFP